MLCKSSFILLITGASLLLLTSCANRLSKQNTSTAVVFPPAPDTARIQFLTALRSSADLIEKQSSFSKFLFGETPPIPISKPYGISIYKGKLVVCDVSLKGLEILDFNKKTFEQFVPHDNGELKLPINCFIDANGILYVADVDRRQVVVFDYQNKYINCFGDTGSFKPTDVFVSGERVYVADSKNNRVNIYRKGFLNLVDYFPKVQPTDSGYLFQPTNICVSKDRIYVSDFGDFKIKIFTLDGKFISAVGGYGKQPGQFVRPKGIAVDSTGNLFVVDAAFENVQMFNSDGNLLMDFGGSYKGPGDMWLPTKIIIDYDNLQYFRRFVDKAYDLQYLIFVTNQFGPDKITVYGAITPAKKN